MVIIDSCRFVYVDEGKVVGWAAISPTSSRCVYKGCVEMVYIMIIKEGIGTELVEQLLQEAKETGILEYLLRSYFNKHSKYSVT